MRITWKWTVVIPFVLKFCIYISFILEQCTCTFETRCFIDYLGCQYICWTREGTVIYLFYFFLRGGGGIYIKRHISKVTQQLLWRRYSEHLFCNVLYTLLISRGAILNIKFMTSFAESNQSSRADFCSLQAAMQPSAEFICLRVAYREAFLGGIE